MADDAPIAEPAAETRPLSLIEQIDIALAPAVRIAAGIGPVGHHELTAVLNCLKSALYTLANYDPDGEPVLVGVPRVENHATDNEARAAAYSGETVAAIEEPGPETVVEDQTPPEPEPVAEEPISEQPETEPA